MQTQPDPTKATPPPQSDNLPPLVDAALLDLLARISRFSDDHFDTTFLALDEAELEQLVVLLLQHWTHTLEGRLLAGCLLIIRNRAQSEGQRCSDCRPLALRGCEPLVLLPLTPS